eukprot:SAG25_NODE_1921_length_2144_cov_1.535452_2_plen_530_part_00
MMTPVTATHACVEAVVLAWKGRATQEQALVQAGQVARVVRDAWLATEKAVAATKETDAAAVVAVEVAAAAARDAAAALSLAAEAARIAEQHRVSAEEAVEAEKGADAAAAVAVEAAAAAARVAGQHRVSAQEAEEAEKAVEAELAEASRAARKQRLDAVNAVAAMSEAEKAWKQKEEAEDRVTEQSSLVGRCVRIEFEGCDRVWYSAVVLAEKRAVAGKRTVQVAWLVRPSFRVLWLCIARSLMMCARRRTIAGNGSKTSRSRSSRLYPVRHASVLLLHVRVSIILHAADVLDGAADGAIQMSRHKRKRGEGKSASGLSNDDIAAAVAAGAPLPDEADGIIIAATVDGGRVSTEGLRAAGLFIGTSATYVPSYVMASYLGESTGGTGTVVRTLCILKVNESGLLQVKDFTTRPEGEDKQMNPARFLWVQIPKTHLVDVVPQIDLPQMDAPSHESALEVALRAVLQSEGITGEQLRETAQKWLTLGYSKTVDAARANEEFYKSRAQDDPEVRLCQLISSVLCRAAHCLLA